MNSSVTEHDLAPLAKAGNRAAVNDLLRRSAQEVRATVHLELLRQRRSFDVADDAFSAAMEAVWASIRAWDPSRGPLVGFARLNIRRAVWQTVAEVGHVCAIPVVAAKKRASAIQARRAALQVAVSADSPLTENPGSPMLRDTFPGAARDLDAEIDSERILARVSADDAELLVRVAGHGESFADVAEGSGVTPQEMHRRFQLAMRRARTVASDPFRRAA